MAKQNQQKTQAMVNQVALPCAEYNQMKAEWDMSDTLWEGTQAMRDAGEQYLPKYEAESSSDYTARKDATVLFNMFSRAIIAATGKVFKKPITLQQDQGKEIGKDLQEWIDNIDGEGKTLNAFAKDLFQDVLRHGLCHFMVDMSLSNAETRAEQKRRGERPYWVKMEAPEIIGWRFEVRGGVKRLTQLRRMYSVREPLGLFDEVIIKRVAVYEPGVYQIYQQGNDKNWSLIEEGTLGVDYIPLVTVYSDRIGFMRAHPAFLNLAYKNIEHWQSCSDQRHILRWARFAIPVISGWDATSDTLTFGPSSLVKLTDPAAKMYFAEHSGAAIESGFKDLEQLKDEMAYLALDPFLRRQPGGGKDITATARILDETGANSSLANWAISLKNGIETGLQYTAGRIGEEFEGSIAINEDFARIDDPDAKIVIEAFRTGLIPRTVAVNELQRLGSFPNYTLEEIGELFEEESRQPGALERIAGRTL